MGCGVSRNNKIGTKWDRGGNIQDEARSYKSKVGAMRLMLKHEPTRQLFKKFIEANSPPDDQGRVEFVVYFEILDELKQLTREEAISRLKKLLELTPTPPDNQQQNNQPAQSQQQRRENFNVSMLLWSCLRPLRALRLDISQKLELMKAIGATQDLLLSPVCPEFEKFMLSKDFQDCKNQQDNNSLQRIIPLRIQTGTADHNHSDDSLRRGAPQADAISINVSSHRLAAASFDQNHQPSPKHASSPKNAPEVPAAITETSSRSSVTTKSKPPAESVDGPIISISEVDTRPVEEAMKLEEIP